MNNWLITGANGQVGRALQELLPDAVALDRQSLDLARLELIPETLAKHRPTAIINAAAYTAVDKAENEEPLATIINGEAPAVLAAYCAAEKIPLVHISTDYVFDGSGEAQWQESADVAPLNAYGRSKLEGEKRVLAQGNKHLIFRTSWVYDAFGSNFFTSMLRLGGQHETLRIVSDQTGAPTYATHLAQAIVTALQNALQQKKFPSGLYHLTNEGETSWYGFAKAIFEKARAEGLPLKVQQVEAIPSSDYPTPAARPHNSRLSCRKAQEKLEVTLPNWRDGLDDCFAAYLETQKANA